MLRKKRAAGSQGKSHSAKLAVAKLGVEKLHEEFSKSYKEEITLLQTAGSRPQVYSQVLDIVHLLLLDGIAHEPEDAADSRNLSARPSS